MILVRDIFQLKFGKAKEAKEGLKKMKELVAKNENLQMGKILTDITGRSYTMVMETEFESLADFEEKIKKAFADKEWQESYKNFIPLVDSASREIYTVVEI